MKTLSLFACLVTLPAALFFACIAPAATTAPAPGERLLQQELKQQQLQRTTQRLGEQLAGIVEEFERNGLAGEDLRTLKAIRLVLGRLSEREMRQVIGLLQQARTSTDATASNEGLTGAYSGQKTIITLLKQLILEYERQQALYELSIRFREMAARQGKNMRAGVWLARNTERNHFNEEQKLSLQVQQMDQVHIKDETGILIGKLNKLASETDGTATGERPKAAARQIKEGGLLIALEAAVEELKTSRILSATGNEKKSRDEMRGIARLLLMSKDLMDLLRAAIRETEAAIILQKQVVEEVQKIEKREDGLTVEDHQFEVVDNTDLIRQDINDVAPTAAGYLRTAIDRMQEARELLTSWENAEKKRRDTPPKQRDAVTSLELAKRALQDQLARAEAEANKPENTLAHLRDLQKEVKELIKREEKLKDNAAQIEKKPQDLRAKAPEQGDIKDKTQDAQQQAANEAPTAAQALSDAASQMEKSQKALAQSKNAPEAQQAAIESLQKADQELGKEIAKLEEAEKQLAGLEQLSEKVGELIKQQEQVNASTAKEAVKPQPSSQQSKDLAQKETGLAKETAEVQKQAEEPAPAAAPHLAEAKSQMNEAKDQLNKPDAKSAQAPEQKALSELFAAKKEIDRQIGDLKQELGLNSDQQDKSLADAMAAIEKAQGEVNQAMAQMANAPPGLLDSLAKQQRQIADALKDTTKSDASPKVDQAQKAASKAADQLNQGDLKQAVGSMQQAQDAIQAAQAGEPAQPSQPGQQPGEKAQPGEQGTPSLPQLGQQQAEVKKQAEALLAAQQAAPAGAMDQAAQQLGQAAQDVTPVAAGDMGPLPAAAQAALQTALNALNSAAAQASAKQQAPAQANAAQAAQALAQAQAALALTEAGLSSEMAQSNQGQGDPQGQGQQPGPGKQPGQGKGNQPGKQPGKQPGRGTPPPRGNGDVGNWQGTGGASGAHRNTPGTGEFVGLPKRDRAAIQQSQGEKYPQEYGPMVEQYLRNLSDQTGQK